MLISGLAYFAQGQVVIHEIVAANSDRLLQRSQPGYPRLGTTEQWTSPTYDDALWKSGSGPFGFGTFSGVTLGVNTSLEMRNKAPSLYVRKTFAVSLAQASLTNQVQLAIRYNDGFVAFLNGKEVARRNMGVPGMFAFRDQTSFSANTNVGIETIVLGLATNLLVSGDNLLCIQTHNFAVTGANSDTLLCQADLSISTASPLMLVANTSDWRYFVGAVEPSGGLIDYGMVEQFYPPAVSWGGVSYNDSFWTQAYGPIGFDRAAPYYTLGANLSNAMYNVAISVYVRSLFTVTTHEALSTNALQMVVDYDDGIIVYINGREAVRRNVGVSNTITAYNTAAPTSHNANGDGTTTNAEVTLSLGPAADWLVPGVNVIAIQIHNRSLTDSDLIGRVTLSATGAGGRVLSRPEDEVRYFIGVREPFLDDAEEGNDLEVDTPDSEGDWIELYNQGSEAVDLGGWSLTDDKEELRKWVFPEGTSISAGGYCVVMATGFNTGPTNGATYLHTNFKLSSEGEYLGLYDAYGFPRSVIEPQYPPQHVFYSYALNEAGQFVYVDHATPGAANSGTACLGIAAPPIFSPMGGFYDSATTVQLSSPDGTATIRYTTDGSEPTETTGTVYGTPLTLSATTVLRARCFKPDNIPSATFSQSYLLFQSAARKSIPALSLAGDRALAFYGTNGIPALSDGQGIMAIKGGSYVSDQWTGAGDPYAFNIPFLRGRSVEKPISFEYYPTNGSPVYTDLGIRIAGSPYTRPRYRLRSPATSMFAANANDKPSFNLFLRSELGESSLEYPFFPGSKLTHFEDLRVRAGHNDITNPYIRDELTRRIFQGTGQVSALGVFASLYINGVWKGYYNFCERARAAFMQQSFNSSEGWDVQQVNIFASGDPIHWNAMITYLRTNTLSAVNAYLGVHTYLDVDNYIDYILVNAFAAMWDWPNNNWIASHERTAAGRWRFFVWDAEGAFGMASRTTTYNTFTTDLTIADAKTTPDKYIPAIYTLLKVSPEFRLRFADRVQKQLFKTGALTQQSMSKNFYMLRDQINPIMKETTTAYLNETFHNTWITNATRRTVFFDQLIEQGLWITNTIAPEFSQHGGDITTNTWISITNLNLTGSIYFTTNGLDPRAPGGAVSGTLYTGAFQLKESATVKARVLCNGSDWSPLQEAIFSVPFNYPNFIATVSPADWTVDANWSTSPMPYPSGTNASAQINPLLAGNRDVNLRASVTNSMLVFNLGETPYRNRITDSGSANSLTFTSPAGNPTVIVNGTGSGYAEFDIDSGVVLSKSVRLTVNNPTGTVAYGALRVREKWSGVGGIIKDGVGVAAFTGEDKSYTGTTLISQGVLQVTPDSAPANSLIVQVSSGGQVRLVSDGTYALGVTLRLAGAGRGGTLPAVSGLGIEGALRFQPTASGAYALVTTPLVFIAPAVIHVEGASNTLALTGALTGLGPLSRTRSFIKTGEGKLILFAASTNYSASAMISNGTVTVHGQLVMPLLVEPGATLCGSGKVGSIQGSGTVALDQEILVASSSVGMNYAFGFGATSPSYSTATTSGNGLLKADSIQHSLSNSVIDICLDKALFSGDTLRGGFFVAQGDTLRQFLTNAVIRFFEPDVNGSYLFAGRTYSAYSGGLALKVTSVPEMADFAEGVRLGYVMEVRASGDPIDYNEWKQSNFLPEEQLLPEISGPLAFANGARIPNLFRYAFNMKRTDVVTNQTPQFAIEAGVPTYRFRFDAGKLDLTYQVEGKPSLTGSWSRVLFNSRTHSPFMWAWDGTLLTIRDEEAGPSVEPTYFYRLRTILDD
jgi:autotransporter-associated beta strand protein